MCVRASSVAHFLTPQWTKLNSKMTKIFLNLEWNWGEKLGELSNLNFPRFLKPRYLIFKANFQSNQVAIPVFKT